MDMLFELIWLTLVPLTIGMGFRRFTPGTGLINFVKANKKPLGLSQNSCILLVVWTMLSGAHDKIEASSSVDLWSCAFMAASVHLVYRLLGYWVATLAQLPP